MRSVTRFRVRIGFVVLSSATIWRGMSGRAQSSPSGSWDCGSVDSRSPVWSAAIILVGSSRIIIGNTAHSEVRRRACLAHELGHHLLEHDFTELLMREDGCWRFDLAKEKEAKFLSGQLLIPDEAAKRAAFDDKTNAQIAVAYWVSKQSLCSAYVMALHARARQYGYGSKSSASRAGASSSEIFPFRTCGRCYSKGLSAGS
jgi:hypothetical protein